MVVSALLAASAALLASTASFAADLEAAHTKAPVYAPPAPIYNWTGSLHRCALRGRCAFGGDNGGSATDPL